MRWRTTARDRRGLDWAISETARVASRRRNCQPRTIRLRLRRALAGLDDATLLLRANAAAAVPVELSPLMRHAMAPHMVPASTVFAAEALPPPLSAHDMNMLMFRRV